MSFNLTKQFGTDPDTEINGYRFELGGGAFILIAREDNPFYQQVMRDVLEPYTAIIGKMEPAEFDKLLVKGLAKGIIRGWGGLTEGEDDTPVGEYSPEKAEALLLQPGDFRKTIEGISKQVRFYRQANLTATKETLGNE
jgi:hypothetical protein